MLGEYRVNPSRHGWEIFEEQLNDELTSEYFSLSVVLTWIFTSLYNNYVKV